VKFNDTTGETGLIQACEDYLGFDTTGISGDASLLKRFTRMINTWYRRADSWIWEADINWEFDDTNRTNLPRATSNMVDDQHDYELPSTARKVIKVMIKDINGDWKQLKPIDKTAYDIPLEEYYDTKGVPNYYDLEGDSLFLYPAPSSSNTTLTSGLKLHFSRDIDEFESSDTTTEPGFDNHFHPILSLGASLDYTLGFTPENTNKIRGLKLQLDELKNEIQTFYGKRFQEHKTRIERGDVKSRSIFI